MAYKIGNANFVFSSMVMVVCLSLIGALPVGFRRLVTGAPNPLRDDFEKIYSARKKYDDEGPTKDLKVVQLANNREALEAEWRSKHVKLA